MFRLLALSFFSIMIATNMAAIGEDHLIKHKSAEWYRLTEIEPETTSTETTSTKTSSMTTTTTTTDITPTSVVKTTSTTTTTTPPTTYRPWWGSFFYRSTATQRKQKLFSTNVPSLHTIPPISSVSADAINSSFSVTRDNSPTSETLSQPVSSISVPSTSNPSTVHQVLSTRDIFPFTFGPTIEPKKETVAVKTVFPTHLQSTIPPFDENESSPAPFVAPSREKPRTTKTNLVTVLILIAGAGVLIGLSAGVIAMMMCQRRPRPSNDIELTNARPISDSGFSESNEAAPLDSINSASEQESAVSETEPVYLEPGPSRDSIPNEMAPAAPVLGSNQPIVFYSSERYR